MGIPSGMFPIGKELLERVAYGGVNALIGHVFPLFQMLRLSGPRKSSWEAAP